MHKKYRTILVFPRNHDFPYTITRILLKTFKKYVKESVF